MPFVEQIPTDSGNGAKVTQVQYIPLRNSIYGIDRGADTVIGFEFVQGSLEKQCFNILGKVALNLCVQIETDVAVDLDTAEFLATDDPCYSSWLVKKNETPDLVILRDNLDKVTGILVRFYRQQTQSYPIQMAFVLNVFDSEGNRFPISKGLLLTK